MQNHLLGHVHYSFQDGYICNETMNFSVVICHLSMLWKASSLSNLMCLALEYYCWKHESSKKNTYFYDTDSLSLLGHAWNLWSNGRVWELMDPILEKEASYPILKRYINVLLLCLQENAADRPTMSEVASMLSNETAILPSPSRPAFLYA